MSTGVLLAAPRARGLLNRAILQSGAPAAQPAADAAALAEELLHTSKTTPRKPNASGGTPSPPRPPPRLVRDEGSGSRTRISGGTTMDRVPPHREYRGMIICPGGRVSS
jgi:hypothetical protein